MGDTSDPTRKCDFGPPSFDQKTINKPAEVGGATTAANSKQVGGQAAAERQIRPIGLELPIWAETAFYDALAVNKNTCN